MASLTTLPPLLSLPIELQLDILDQLEFWDLYALRLTNRHFANLTPPLNDLKVTFCSRLHYPGVDQLSFCLEFDCSWLAITSNLTFDYQWWNWHPSNYESYAARQTERGLQEAMKSWEFGRNDETMARLGAHRAPGRLGKFSD